MMRRACLFGAMAMVVAAFPAHAWDAARGKEISTVCSACHGVDGNSPTPDFPIIAGQHAEYLYRSLLDYKLGNRGDPIMQGQVAELSRADMRDLAAYFASQDGLHLKR
jgi:cytochrome c553